jgi:hypothetical protein
MEEPSAESPGERPVPRWIETDFHGNIVRRVDIPQKNIEAFSSNGSLYARRYSGGFVVFDAATKSWRTVGGHPGGRLLGADANKLVFLVGDNTVVWSGQQ